MGLPKRRHSRSRTRKRRTHQVLSLPALTKCGNCGATRLMHNACRHCGYYRGRPVVRIREKKAKAEEEKES